MELVVTLSNKDNLIALMEYGVDGIITGSLFSSRFNLSLKEMTDIILRANSLRMKAYVSIDTFIFEDDIKDLYLYFEELSKLNVEGIYFSDLAVIDVAKSYGLESLLIYDGGPILTNSLDIESYLDTGIDSVVLARELSMNETLDIIKHHPHKVDMQIFGHLRLSTSKRKFLTNYFKQIGSNYEALNKTTLRIVEEKRDYKMPIMESEYGTSIYSDFILEAIEELPYLRKMIKRGIIDDLFVPFEMVIDIIKAYRRCEEKNSFFIERSYVSKYKKYPLGKGYYYTKLNIVKDEQN